MNPYFAWKRFTFGCFALCISLSAACGPDDGERLVASAYVGTEGGRVAGGGMLLDVPAGALPSETEITVHASYPASFQGHELLAPIFRFEPDGLAFDVPASFETTIPEGRTGMVFWSSADGDGYDYVGTAESGRSTAAVTHFSDTLTMAQCALQNECLCFAGDAEGGALCKVNPEDTDGRCPVGQDVWGEGVEGGPCEGHARRDVVDQVCFCNAMVTRSDTGARGTAVLCPVAWRMVGGSPRCDTTLHSEDEPGHRPDEGEEVRGTRSYVAPDNVMANGAGCDGHWVDYNAQGQPVPREASGTMGGCQAEITGAEYLSLPGNLGACEYQAGQIPPCRDTEPGPPPDMTPPPAPPADPAAPPADPVPPPEVPPPDPA